MARHIVARAERPVFLYGQPYGGGHALVAYAAAPLFAAFGASGALLTGIGAALSLVSVWLVWHIMRRWFDPLTAAAAAGLYAFSPPVVYQAFLVNGGTESFLLALCALALFLRAYLDARTGDGAAFLCGLLCGLAWYAMDYALLYPIVFVLLMATSGRPGRWRYLAMLAAGAAVGCAPLIVHNLTHDFAHVRHMLSPGGGASQGFLPHVAGAVAGIFTGDLAAFFGGDIDDFRRAGVGAWLHAGAALAATAWLIWTYRRDLTAWLRNRPLGEKGAPLPAALLPAVFVLVYLGIYAVARFSLPELRTPRYFLPLCPFVSSSPS